MTSSTAVDLVPVTEAGVRTFLDEAVRRGWRPGVIAITGRPTWSGSERLTSAEGDTVAVTVCTSTLAVREALLRRHETPWLVIVTDLSGEDLGPEICSYLVWQRPRRPDPWESVMRLFAATGLERRLVLLEHNRDVAHGVAALAGSARLAAAPGGVLTVEHLVSVVCAKALELGQPGRGSSADQLVAWSVTPGASDRWAALVDAGGEPLIALVRRTLAEQLGPAGRAVDVVLDQGRVADVAALGLVARVVADVPATDVARDRFVRLAGGPREHELEQSSVLRAWADASETVVRGLVRGDDSDRATANAVLTRADAVMREVRALDLAGTSPLLQAGLDQRLSVLAERLRAAVVDVDAHQTEDVDVPLADGARLAPLEQALASVEDHVLAPADPRPEACRQAARLTRWLSKRPSPVETFAAACAVHRDEDAWVDRAVDAVIRGADDEQLAQALGAVARATTARRRSHDRRFAALLAQHTAQGLSSPPGTTHLEDAVARVVTPLLSSARVLLVVADGMSLAVATEVVDSTVGSYQSWQECVPVDETRRHLGIAVLPTLTKVSRTSLLCGRLTDGAQREERLGLASLVAGAPLFHKASLDASPEGYVLGDGVSEAINNPSLPLVACVLNTVDDALDRSDVGGIVWDAASVRHLRPLLDAARRAGRVVVLTADHGHVIERGSGATLSRPGATSNRSRPAGAAVEQQEVLVRGTRVVTADQQVVLAVDADVRYSAKKAGYHGGASPAEVLVPLVVLTAGPAPTGWDYAQPQAPRWWREPAAVAAPTATAEESPTLFEPVPVPEPATPVELPVVQAVIRSATWKRQTARRSTVSADQVAQLLRALLQAPGRRLTRESAAAELGVSAADFRFNGAIAAVERVLNVEQYPVISRTADGAAVMLDEALLREQFEVGPA